MLYDPNTNGTLVGQLLRKQSKAMMNNAPSDDGWMTPTKPTYNRARDGRLDTYKDIYLDTSSPSESDIRKVAAFVEDDNFFYSLLNPAVYNDPLAAARAIMTPSETNTCMVIRSVGTDTVFGCINFVKDKNVRNRLWRKAEIRYFIGAAHQNKKLGSYTILRAMNWAIKSGGGLGLHSLFATVDPDNVRSMAILTNAGMTLTDLIPAEKSPYYDRNGKKSQRIVMEASFMAMDRALRIQRNLDKYTNLTLIAQDTRTAMHYRTMTPTTQYCPV